MLINQLLAVAVGRLRERKMDRVETAQLAEWSDLSEFEVKTLLRKYGVKVRLLHRARNERGYLRLDLMELMERLEQERLGQSEAPLSDWFCQECGGVFEARSAICPEGESHRVHRVLVKPPATHSERTTLMDHALRKGLEGQGLTDYVPQKKVAKYDHPLWGNPAQPLSVGSKIGQMYPQYKNIPGIEQVQYGAPAVGGGKAQLSGETARGGFTTSSGESVKLTRTPTQVLTLPNGARAIDNSPLPPV